MKFLSAALISMIRCELHACWVFGVWFWIVTPVGSVCKDFIFLKGPLGAHIKKEKRAMQTLTNFRCQQL